MAGAIVGGRSPKQVEGIIGAAEFCLSKDQINHYASFIPIWRA
ncbi:MAG: hypothetical protein AB1861_00215 [Cyanobacteriota bacterium]